jgi:superoxide reductase
MDRRTFIKAAALSVASAGLMGEALAAEKFFPTKVDAGLFQTINRVKDPANKTPLETTHAPEITAPDKVKAGEPFTVEISVGEKLHPMGPTHWIQFIQLSLGNEPAGRATFQPAGYLKPKASFTVVVPKEAAPEGKITLVANQQCNLHGYWESSKNVIVE